MKKNGIIPPHFLYFLENEGMELTNFRSGNLNKKDEIDRLIVRFPYSSKDIEIQTIFDNYDYSTPPDFILLGEENFIIDYQEIINEWNFKESSSLYKSLFKIKEKYNLLMENKLLNEIKKINNGEFSLQYIGQNSSYIKDIYTSLKKKIKTYKKIETNLPLEYVINYEKNLSEIVFSYPLDCNIRIRNIKRYLYLNLHFPMNERKFSVSFKLPSYLKIDFGLKFNEYFDIIDFDEVVQKFENKMIFYFNTIFFRESVVNKIIRSNIAIPLEINTDTFEKFTLYFIYSKTNILKDTSIRRNIETIMNPLIPANHNPGLFINLFLSFQFDKEFLNLQIIDRDKMKVLTEKPIVISSSNCETEANKILDECLKELNSIVKLKGMK